MKRFVSASEKIKLQLEGKKESRELCTAKDYTWGKTSLQEKIGRKIKAKCWLHARTYQPEILRVLLNSARLL